MTVMLLVTFVGLAFYSCTKSQDPAAQSVANTKNQGQAALPEVTLKPGQVVYPELVKAMVGDQLVKDYVLADVTYTMRYATWYQSLSSDAKQARHRELYENLKSGKGISDPSHTQQETADYLAIQVGRRTEINAKYPKLLTLGDEEFASVQGRVFSIVTEDVPMNAVGGCVAGYYACAAGCAKSSNCMSGCIAGYNACIDANPNSW